MENLASTFKQKYQKFEIIFSVADSNDPVIQIVEKLQKLYPLIDSRLIIGFSNYFIYFKFKERVMLESIQKLITSLKDSIPQSTDLYGFLIVMFIPMNSALLVLPPN